MEFRFLPTFAIALVLAFAVSQAALPAEMYWKSVFPNTPMPKALRNLLLPAGSKQAAFADMVKDNKNKDGAADSFGNYGYANPNSEFKGTKNMLTDMVKNNGDKAIDSFGNYGYADPSKEFKGTKNMLTDMVKNKDKTVDSFGNYGYADPSKEFKGTKNMLSDMVKNKDKATDSFGNYGYADPSKEFKGNKNMLTDMAKNKDKLVDSFGNYGYANPNKEFANGKAPTNNDVYFFESELHAGRRMNLKDLVKKPTKATFLPRAVAESIPFSTQKLAEIYKYFSLDAKSAEANLLEQTIENCERPAIQGEEKYCATSLESFIDLGVSKLGKNIQLLSNELEKETENQEFTIGEGVKMMGESEIVCHKMKYAYAVFLCHSIDKTAVYTVPVVGADGTRARALAVCHKDTSAWNPKHLAFQVLKVKPGSVPICHFLVRETLVWISK